MSETVTVALSGLLSLFMPGFGQIYNTRLARGVAFWVLGVMVALTLAWAVILVGLLSSYDAMQLASER